MNLLTAIKTVLNKYVDSNGRATRSEFWYWILGVVVLSLVLALIEGVLLAPALGFTAFSPEAGQPLRFAMSLAIFLPCIMVAIRRLHDIERSGWWLLIQIVPVIGSLVLLWWYVQPGTEGPNEYG